MVKLSVCIEMFWPDLPFEQRITRVAALGYSAFEFWGWKNKDIDKVKTAIDATGLTLAALCVEPNFCLIKRNTSAELLAGMQESVHVAQKLGCSTMIVTTGNTYDDESFEISRRRVVGNLALLGKLAADSGITMVLEPLNTLVDHHGYWLTKMAQAADIVAEIGSPAVKILMDLYHQQVQEGNLTANIRQYIQYIGHFHTAGVPGRHELAGSELDYRSLFQAIDATGYTRYVGLEYSPTIDAMESLRQPLALLK
ncbi:MAG: TIM barrel protein [Chloroflexi bacterium]|nr:TIM barrel protein [Chloroflexota bacterium]